MTSYDTSDHDGTGWWSERNRALYYRVALALIPIAAVAGIVSDELAPTLVGLAVALFGSGLAVRNTST